LSDYKLVILLESAGKVIFFYD